MAKARASSRRAIRERVRQRRQRQRYSYLAMVVGGIVLLAGSVYLLTRGSASPARAALDYAPEDVAHERPLHAVHEMEPPSLASIPFLPQDGPQPQIAVSEDFYSFGQVGYTQVMQHEFVIANLGEAPLTISRAYTTCGCTTADFTASVIPPGKVSVMTLVFDAGYHDVRGQSVRRGVILENNDPQNPQVEIWTEAQVLTSP